MLLATKRSDLRLVNIISTTISNNAVEELGLEPGKDALAVVKAASVMVGID